MSLVGQEGQIVDSSGLCKAQAVGVVIAIHVVRINAVTSLVFGHLDTSRHDGSDVGGVGVQPIFSRPTLQLAALIRGLKRILVRTPVFETPCREIADDFLAILLQCFDSGTGSVKEIHVVNINGKGEIAHGATELNLPICSSYRLPHSPEVCWCRL